MEWIKWEAPYGKLCKGEGRPVDGDVDYKLRHGYWYYNRPAENLFWDNRGDGNDIVAYRKSHD